MDKKVIYVDFKAASKKSKHKEIPIYKESTFFSSEKKSFTQRILERFSLLFKLFKKNKPFNNVEPLHKHWL